MAELLSSKIVIQEEEPRIRSFPALASAVAGIQGIAERGPIGIPTLINSYEEYENIFGSFLNGYELALAVRAFFLNGGRECHVSRTVHYTNYLDKNTASAVKGSVMLQTDNVAPGSGSVEGTISETWALANGDTLIGSVGGNPNQTATFTAAAAALECVTAENYALSNLDTLTVKIDQGSTQTITFLTSEFVAIGAATAEEVAAVINAKIVGAQAAPTSGATKVTITSDTKGTNSEVEVTGGSANGALGFSIVAVPGTGNVADISVVTFTEAKTLIEAAWTSDSGVTCTLATGSKLKITTVNTGAAASVQVIASSTADDEFGLDNAVHSGTAGGIVNTLKLEGKTAGAYVNALSAKVTAASSGEASEFNLAITKAGLTVESFPNVTMDTTDSRYVETVVNNEDSGSNLFVAEDQSAAGTSTERRPADTSGTSASGGDDGLTSLDINDFIGDKNAQTGIYAFDAVPEMTLLINPDWTHVNIHKAMIEYCRSDRKKQVFTVLDPPAGYSVTQILSHKATLDGELGVEHGAIYWPRVKIINPSIAIFGSGSDITVAPSGTITGIMSRNDRTASEGPFYQPAGVEAGKPTGVVALENDDVLLEPKRDKIFPKRINPITSLRGFGVFVDGARTMKGDGNFPSVGERRGVSHIERLLEVGLQWVRHRNHTAALRADIERTIFAELYGWMSRGAFASGDPSTAFFIDVSEGLNPPSVVRSGQVKIRIGLATNTPAEFIIIAVTKDTRALEEELAVI